MSLEERNHSHTREVRFACHTSAPSPVLLPLHVSYLFMYYLFNFHIYDFFKKKTLTESQNYWIVQPFF